MFRLGLGLWLAFGASNKQMCQKDPPYTNHCRTWSTDSYSSGACHGLLPRTPETLQLSAVASSFHLRLRPRFTTLGAASF